MQGAPTGGRWDDGTFDVLYTSFQGDGAIAEIYYHVTKGQPVMPSRVTYACNEISASLGEVLDLSEITDLSTLGVDVNRYGRLSYAERPQEYPTTQQIAEVAHFLDFTGVLVPNARWPCANLVVFSDRVALENLSIGASTPIDWAEWHASRGLG